jgi:hypothetical protein
MKDVIGLRRFDCEGIVSFGRGIQDLLALVFFLARWSDAERVRFTTGMRAN